jgi:hypothetical protein
MGFAFAGMGYRGEGIILYSVNDDIRQTRPMLSPAVVTPDTITRMEYPKPIPANDPPKAGVYVLAFELGHGWGQAKYFPDDANKRYQPDAWHFVGDDAGAWGREVTHWLPMPPQR